MSAAAFDGAPPLRVAFVAEGDAETRDCWSGCAQGFVRGLRNAGVEVTVIDAQLAGWRRLAVAARAWHPSKARWRHRFTLGDEGARAKSRLAARALRGHAPFDAVIQAGATFTIPRAALAGARHVVYCDANIRFAQRGAPWSAASRLDGTERLRIAAREQRVYDAADRIWPWSDVLAESFEQDFGVAAKRLRTLYAGANTDHHREPPPRPAAGTPPTALFVGKDHVRKGSADLLAAWPRVREAVPDAELHIVGAVPPGADALPGVTAHGFVNGGTADGAARLADLYRRATVFCMPSRYEPFGVVFAEAMLAALPCIGADAWAMPEIIVPGTTGWLVPPGDPVTLAGALGQALGDPARSAAMGRAARARALELFVWDRVAERAVADLHALRESRLAAPTC